ncbi:type II toxin-antitoxin system YoeB family toxin [Kitasatospora purpeofusca]|nr:type II toxin-antitoxin system YoeB family toxin [Kitasatospora purpeofusca]
MKLAFTPEGWDDYLYWQAADKKALRKLNELVIHQARFHYSR